MAWDLLCTTALIFLVGLSGHVRIKDHAIGGGVDPCRLGVRLGFVLVLGTNWEMTPEGSCQMNFLVRGISIA